MEQFKWYRVKKEYSPRDCFCEIMVTQEKTFMKIHDIESDTFSIIKLSYKDFGEVTEKEIIE